MWRKGLVLLLLVALAMSVLLPPASVWAEAPSVTNYSPDDSPPDNNPDEGQDEGLIAKIIAKLFVTINEAIAAMGFSSVEQLIYNLSEAKLQFEDGGIKPKYLSATGPNFGLYSDSEWQHVKTFYGISFALAWLAIVYQLILVGVAIAKPTDDPDKRRSIQEAFGSLIATGIFVTISWVPVAFFLEINNAFVEMLSQPIRRSGSIGTAVITDSALVGALINFLFILAMIAINIQYLLRKFAITVLFVIAPLVACLWLSKSRRVTLFVWLSELASQVFLQAAHALVFLLFWTLYFAGRESGSIFGVWWAPIVMIFALTPIGNLLRKLIVSLFGVRFHPNEEKEATVFGLAGFGQMATLAVAGVGALGRGIGSLSSYVSLSSFARKFIPSGPGGGGGPSGGPDPDGVPPSGLSPTGTGGSSLAGASYTGLQAGGTTRINTHGGIAARLAQTAAATVPSALASGGYGAGAQADAMAGEIHNAVAGATAGAVPAGSAMLTRLQGGGTNQTLAAVRGVGRPSASTLQQIAGWAKQGYAIGGAIGAATGRAMVSAMGHMVPYMHVSSQAKAGVGQLGRMIGGTAGAAMFAAAGTVRYLGGAAIRSLSQSGGAHVTAGAKVIPFPARTQPSVGIERPSLTPIQGGKVRANRFGAPFHGGHRPGR